MISIFFVCLKDQQNQAKIIQEIESHVGPVTVINHGAELLNKTFVSATSAVLITDYLDDTFQETWTQIRFPLKVLLYTKQPLADFIRWFKPFNIMNQVIQADEFPHLEELIATLQKIIKGNIFGVDKYLVEQVNIYKQELQHSEQRFAIMDQVMEFMNPLTPNPKFKRVVKSVLEELFMNAFYSAPVDATGEHPYANLDRALPVQLPADKHVSLTYAFDNKNLLLSVSDPYGSLAYNSLIASLLSYFEGELSVKEGTGGAGLGLAKVYKNISRLVVNIAPKQCTEMIAFIDLSTNFLEFQKRPRSLNIFVQ